jgi:signal transduction histidine kinase
MFDAQTAFLVVGFLLVALPATAWTILDQRHDRRSVALWCFGGLLYGIAFILMSLKAVVPPWLSSVVANPLAFAGFLLRGMAMRRELASRARNADAILVCALLAVAYVLAYLVSAQEAPRLVIAVIANATGACWLTWLSAKVYRRRGFRSAAMMTAAYGLFAAALMLRLVTVIDDWAVARVLTASVDVALAVVSGGLAALYGNLGYIGLALEASRVAELARGADLAREQERGAQTELRVREQALLLEERGRLLASREEMLAALAHEVRQPLNNASAALQSAAQALTEDHPDREQAAARLLRAKTVLSQVTSALDNTLTDAVMLGNPGPLARQDIDVDVLIALVIADIDPANRHRVLCERVADTRTASMNAGLMRLALRNLISNALAYGPAEANVTVRIADSDEPLALILDVCDSGDGIPAELLPRLFTRGARGDHVHNPRGHGLGLYIVHRIMEMHDGAVEVHPGNPRGLTMRLVIPQSFAS